MREKLHILHIPKWYPNPEDPQLGIFIQKQIQAASQFDTQSVLYIKSVKELDSEYILEEKQVADVLELHIYYKKSESRTKQFVLLKKLYNKGFKKIQEKLSKPDVLHVHNLIVPAVWANKYASKHNIPWVLSEHWSGYTSRSGVFESKMMWERKIWQYYSERAKCTISVSAFLEDALKKNAIGKKHRVIPNVVEAVKGDVKREDDEIRILNVSDMVDDIKNISGLLDAFSSICQKYPNARLYLVGGGDDLEEMKNKARKLGIEECVTFFGRLKNEDVLALYHDIDFVVVNSRIETFSVVAAEALLAGKPVITTRCGGVEEFITDSHGILISIDDNSELEEALENMLTNFNNYDPDTLINYSQNKFSSEAIGLSLSNIYHLIAK